MAFTLMIGCGADYTPHRLTFTDDGEVRVDPDKHDEDLERSLAEMGAELPNCLRTAEALRTLPISVLAELRYFYREARNKAMPLISAKPYIAAHIGADAVEHVAKQFSDPSPERQLALRVVQQVRELQDASDDKPHVDALLSLEHSLIELYGTARRESPYEQLAYAGGMLASRAYSRESSYHSTNDVLITAQRAVAAMQATDNEAGVAQDAEARWQSRQLIRGINATLEGKPWPSAS